MIDVTEEVFINCVNIRHNMDDVNRKYIYTNRMSLSLLSMRGLKSDLHRVFENIEIAVDEVIDD